VPPENHPPRTTSRGNVSPQRAPGGEPNPNATDRTPEHGTGVVGTIPARYASTRLPGKPLLHLAGKPMIEHVYRRAEAVPTLDRVLVLTDDERIGRAVDRFGGEWQMTPTECASGTDRIAWAVREWPAEIRAVVNIQGDEPLIEPEVVDRLARHLADNPDDPIVTLATAATAEELDDPNAVKVVCDREGYALYFSRAAIPYRRDPGSDPDVDPVLAPVLKHLGLYGYQTSALLRFAELPPSPLERTESLEQLRALENRMPLRVLITDWSSPGVDTRDDLARVERLLVERAARQGAERGH